MSQDGFGETSEDLDVRFNHYPPKSRAVELGHDEIRESIKEAAEDVMRVVPAGRERSLALTKLEEAMMWANAGLARGLSA